MTIRDAMTASKLRADGTNASQRATMQFLLDRFRRIPTHWIDGIKPSNGTDATNDIDFSAGMALSSNGFCIPIDATSKRLDATFALGGSASSPVGGLASALTVSNTSYHAHALFNPENGLSDVGFDTSVTATNLLADSVAVNAGLTEYCRVFSFYRTAGANVVFTAREIAGGGLEVLLAAGVQDVSVNNPGVAAVSYTLSVPLGVKLDALGVLFSNRSLAGVAHILLTSLDQTDSTPSLTNFTNRNQGLDSQSTRFGERTNTSGQVRLRTDASDANLNWRINTRGWIDERVA